MYTIKATKLTNVCDYLVTKSSFGTGKRLFIEKHLSQGAVLVKEVNEEDIPAFVDGNQYLKNLIEMQKLGASRNQSVLLIIGASEYSAELSANWQILGGLCVIVPEEKRKMKVLSTIAGMELSDKANLLISIPYVSCDIIANSEWDENYVPLFLQVLSLANNGEHLEAFFGMKPKRAEQIRTRLGIPEKLNMFTYKNKKDAT
jgi:hypothetical protein